MLDVVPFVNGTGNVAERRAEHGRVNVIVVPSAMEQEPLAARPHACDGLHIAEIFDLNDVVIQRAPELAVSHDDARAGGIHAQGAAERQKFAVVHCQNLLGVKI